MEIPSGKNCTSLIRKEIRLDVHSSDSLPPKKKKETLNPYFRGFHHYISSFLLHFCLCVCGRVGRWVLLCLPSIWPESISWEFQLLEKPIFSDCRLTKSVLTVLGWGWVGGAFSWVFFFFFSLTCLFIWICSSFFFFGYLNKKKSYIDLVI